MRVGVLAGELDRRGLGHLAVEIDTRLVGKALAELVAQHLGLHHLDGTHGQVAELERTEAHADQAVDLKAQRGEHVLDLAVLALAQAEDQPDIGALLALQLRVDGPVADAIDLDALLEGLELGLGDRAEGPHAVPAQPAGCRQLQHALQPAIIGEQQQALGVDVEPADGDDARQAFLLERIEYGGTALGILFGDHEARRLVIEPDAGAFPGAQQAAIDLHLVPGGDVEGGGADHLAVDGDAAVLDPQFGVAARAEAGAGDDLGQAVALKGGGCRGHFLLLRDRAVGAS